MHTLETAVHNSGRCIIPDRLQPPSQRGSSTVTVVTGKEGLAAAVAGWLISGPAQSPISSCRCRSSRRGRHLCSRQRRCAALRSAVGVQRPGASRCWKGVHEKQPLELGRATGCAHAAAIHQLLCTHHEQRSGGTAVAGRPDQPQCGERRGSRGLCARLQGRGARQSVGAAGGYAPMQAGVRQPIPAHISLRSLTGSACQAAPMSCKAVGRWECSRGISRQRVPPSDGPPPRWQATGSRAPRSHLHRPPARPIVRRSAHAPRG